MRHAQPFLHLLRLVLAACAWHLVPAAAAPVLDLAQTAPVSITPYAAVFEDTSAALSLAEVMQAQYGHRFAESHPKGEVLGFSYTTSAIWVRLQVRNSSTQAVTRVLEVGYALLAEIDLFQIVDGSVVHQVSTGYARPFAARPYPSRQFVIPLTLAAGSHSDIYIRVTSSNSISLPAKFWEPSEFHQHDRASFARQLFYFGILAAISLYNFMLFLSLRDANYLLYVVSTLTLGLALATFNGLSTQYLWGDSPALTKLGVNLSTAISAIAILSFTRRLLTTASLVPTIDKALVLFIGGNAVSAIALTLAFEKFTPYFVTLTLFTSLFLLATGVVCAVKRQRAAYYFIVAYAAILIAIALTHLRNLGILPSNTLTVEGTQIGSAIEMLLLSFALADRYNGLRREKAKAQAEALEAQTLLVESLKSSERILEARVAERTLELTALNAQLVTMGNTDALTGIANRRSFDATLEREWLRARRSGQPLAIGMVDVDFFKKYNDTYGHQAGDECLRAVAEVLTKHIGRGEDVVARYGGEEFVFIAPNLRGEEALALATRVCASLEAKALPHAASDLGYVTASIGVISCTNSAGKTAESLLMAADAALYRAKANGRNQAVLGEVA